MDKSDLKTFVNLKRGKKAKKGRRYSIKSTAGQGAKQTKVKGRTQAIIDLLRQAKTNDDTMAVRRTLSGKGIKVKEEDADFYASILSLTYNNVKININDILNGRKFKYYYYSDLKYKTSHTIFHNDKLAWFSELVNVIPKEILNLLLVNDITLSLQTKVVKSSGYEKGYIQDYSKNFCFIGKSTIATDKIKDLANNDIVTKFFEQNPTYARNYWASSAKAIDFTFNNVKYIGFSLDNGFVLCYDEKLKEKLVSMMSNVKTYENKNNLKDGFKVFKLDDEMNVFISQRISLVDFIPGIVIFKRPVSYIYSIEMDYDMGAFDDFLRTRYTSLEKKKGELDEYFVDSLVTWETLDLFINYLFVLNQSVFIPNAWEINIEAGIFISKYNDDKDYFVFLKKTMISITNFIMKFFDTFYNKINIDTCKSLLKQYNNKLRGVFTDVRENAELNNKFVGMIEGAKLSKTIRVCYNCMKNFKEIELIVNNIVAVLEQIDNGIATDLEKNLRSTGVSIFDSLRSSNADTYLINEIRTPYLFLGNLIGSGSDELVAKRMIEGFVTKTLKMELDKSKMADVIKKYLSADKGELLKIGLAAAIESVAKKKTMESYEPITFTENFNKWYETQKESLNPASTDDNTLSMIVYGDAVKNNKEKINPSGYGLKDEEIITFAKTYATDVKLSELKKEEEGLRIKKKINALEALVTLKDKYNLNGIESITFEEKKPEDAPEYTKSMAGEKMTFFNLDGNKFLENEYVTLEKMKRLNIPTIEFLTGGDIKDGNTTIKAWRKLGIADPIIWKFMSDRGFLPKVGEHFYYYPELLEKMKAVYGGGLKLDAKTVPKTKSKSKSGSSSSGGSSTEPVKMVDE